MTEKHNLNKLSDNFIGEIQECGLSILNDEALDYNRQVLGITIEGTSGVLGKDEYCPKPQ